ncbi:uncharacterized protein METZ01_LOCUS353064, partial [marine metagenome]
MLAASEARKMTGAEISSGSARSPRSRFFVFTASANARLSFIAPSAMGERVTVGATALTRMPNSAHSAAIVLVR